MTRSCSRLLIGWNCLIAAAIPTQATAQNFLSSNKELVRAAESARVASAIFWTSQPLPGDWSAPCPIQVTSRTDPAGGCTRFQFARGEVFNWRMTIYGQQSSLLDDVIPHEVDHMVRATLVRRPVVRWLDEGCATLFESPAARERLRQTSLHTDISALNLDWLTSDEYPTSADHTEQLYACGFSLVEYLLTLQSPATLLELQKADPDLPSAFQRLYGFPLVQLPTRWQTARKASPSVSPPRSPTSLPVLTVWTAPWCPPCRQFHRDFSDNIAFHNQLTSAFDVRFINADEHGDLANERGIQQLPTFETSSHQWVGYTNSATLLQQLGLNNRSAPPGAEPQPDSSESTLPGTPTLPTQDQDLTSITVPSDAKPSNPSRPPLMPAFGPPVPEAGAEEASRSWPDLLSVASNLLPWIGILGGTAATGGLGGIGLSLLIAWLRRPRRKAAPSGATQENGGGLDIRFPFPRQLDEARQLLQLRQSEGRVAVLDALRGMFLDDELERLQHSEVPAQQAVASQLRTAIDQRVDEVAPLSTTIPS